ncbi:2-dehydro-3-deoxygalactonokinase [soil metagenome]
MSENFLSCDWGTSHFRLRLVDALNLEVRGEIKTSEGVAAVASQAAPETRSTQFAEILVRHVDTIFQQTNCRATSCIISGMASSNLGWVEVPYAEAPLSMTFDHLQKRIFEIFPFGPPIAVTLVSGVRTDNDVMRGEECELIGLLESNPELSDSNVHLLLPGTHSKHVHLKSRRLESFVTFMTGELFEHLRNLPTLRTTLKAETEMSMSDFLDGVWVAKKCGLSAGLFKIRARSILSQQECGAQSFLSGLIIADELLHLPDAPCYLAAPPGLQSIYLNASDQIGREIIPIHPDCLRTAILRAHRLFLP